MTDNTSLATVVAYYLSRFDANAYQRLGFSTVGATHAAIGELLNVKATTLKNLRDEFDPLHGNRVGWWQRPMRANIVRMAESLQLLDEEELGDIVEGILSDKGFRQSQQLAVLLQSIEQSPLVSNESKGMYVARGPTGTKAEDFFRTEFEKGCTPFSGTLVDRRDDGCGYDFQASQGADMAFIEVKGLGGSIGGISLTSKEWHTAQSAKDRYFLIIVRDVHGTPAMQVIQNPASQLSPKKHVFTVVQVQWNVTDAALQLDMPMTDKSSMAIPI